MYIDLKNDNKMNRNDPSSKIIHKIFIPQKYFHFSDLPPPPKKKKKEKYWNLRFWTQAYVYMKISEYPPPPPNTHTHLGIGGQL